ncbi:MAG TPA: DUF3305 domain-containing protein [Burkholderiales bacterium]|nr:DUF3305 domain-containing protein [Burkholderiales bacterium]
MEKATKTLSVVMQRRNARSRWASVIWEPVSVLESEEPAGAARLLVRQDDYEQWLHAGFELAIHRDEIEGYYMNVSSDSPRVFVLWRMEGEQGLPLQVTASYDEGGRWLDGGHSVDSVTMPPAVFGWIGEYVEKNYRPEPKKRVKPRSFIHPKDRVGR